MDTSDDVQEGVKSLGRAMSQSAEAGLRQFESRLLRWLKMLVGEANRECVMAIFEAMLILVEDVLKIGAAYKTTGREGAMLEVYALFKDIVMVALLLPPRCIDDPELAAHFDKAYAVLNLVSRDNFDDMSFTEAEQLINNLSDVTLDSSLIKQVVASLRDGARTGDLETQIGVAAVLLPDEALEKIDAALNARASDLPGAAFIDTLNKYDNDLGIDIIPDDVVNGPAIDLLIRTARVTGLIETADAEFLFTLTNIMRREVAAALGLTALERMRRFIEKAIDDPSPPIEIAPEQPRRRRPVRIEIVPQGDEIKAPAPTGRIEINEGVTKRMKMLAGIK